jgi:hypothetical protein
LQAAWTDVAAGTTLTPTAAQTFLSCDSTGAQTTVNLPAAASAFDGQIQLVKLTGATVTPVVVNAGAGTTVELLNASGTFGAQTYLTDQGQAAFFKYDLATTSWKAFSLYDGNAAAAQAQTAWQIDPQNVEGTSANTNTGLTAGTALRQWAEVIRRTKNIAWSIAASVTVTFLSSHTDNTDPVQWLPTVINGATPVIQGAPVAGVAAVFTLNTARSTVAGANALLSGSFSAGAPAAGVLVTNTTAGKSSRAFVYLTAGGANLNLSQPMVPASGPSAGAPVQVNTWASTDTVTLTPVASRVAVNLINFQVNIIGDYNGTFNNIGYLYNLVIFNPDAFGTVILANVILQECNVSRLSIGGPYWNDIQSCVQFSNCYNPEGMESSQRMVVYGGLMAGTSFEQGGSIILDGDVILGLFNSLLTYGQIILGRVYMDHALNVQGGELINETTVYGTHVIYGSAGGQIQLSGAAHGWLDGGTYTASWTMPSLITGITMNGVTTAQSLAIVAAIGTINAGIATSVANLDAAAGPAGFGGTAANYGGASLSQAV